MENDRRDFLKASAKFMGVLTAFGLTGSAAHAQTLGSPLKAPGTAPAGVAPRAPMPSPTTLNAVMTDALATKDMAKTLPKFKGQLTAEQFNTLKKLTPQDLAQLETIKIKLGPSAVSGDDDHGIILW